MSTAFRMPAGDYIKQDIPGEKEEERERYTMGRINNYRRHLFIDYPRQEEREKKSDAQAQDITKPYVFPISASIEMLYKEHASSASLSDVVQAIRASVNLLGEIESWVRENKRIENGEEVWFVPLSARLMRQEIEDFRQQIKRQHKHGWIVEADYQAMKQRADSVEWELWPERGAGGWGVRVQNG